MSVNVEYDGGREGDGKRWTVRGEDVEASREDKIMCNIVLTLCNILHNLVILGKFFFFLNKYS